MSLIKGMDEVVAYIKEQDKKIKELTEKADAQNTIDIIERLNDELDEEQKKYRNDLTKFQEQIADLKRYKEYYETEQEFISTYGYEFTEEFVDGEKVKTEYRIHISGGGDPNKPNGWEDYVIKYSKSKQKLLYYIRHSDNESPPDQLQVGKVLVSDCDGDDVCWVDEDKVDLILEDRKVNALSFDWLENELVEDENL